MRRALGPHLCKSLFDEQVGQRFPSIHSFRELNPDTSVLRRKSADFPENTSPYSPISPTENSRRCCIRSRTMQSPLSQVSPCATRIETELPVWPTEKCRQNGAHRIYRRTLSNSISIDDLARLPGNTEVSGFNSRKEWIRRIDGGRGGIRTPDTLSGTPVFKTGAINHSATLPCIHHKPSASPAPHSTRGSFTPPAAAPIPFRRAQFAGFPG